MNTKGRKKSAILCYTAIQIDQLHRQYITCHTCLSSAWMLFFVVKHNTTLQIEFLHAVLYLLDVQNGCFCASIWGVLMAGCYLCDRHASGRRIQCLLLLVRRLCAGMQSQLHYVAVKFVALGQQNPETYFNSYLHSICCGFLNVALMSAILNPIIVKLVRNS